MVTHAAWICPEEDGGFSMADIRRVTDDFAVAPQLASSDFAAIAALGYRSVINNRPDGEMPGQLSSAQAQAAATSAGIAYVHAPFAGMPSAEAVEAIKQALDRPAGPVLAYCRSGTRSVTAWAIAQVATGKLQPDEIISLAAGAGYDLAPLKGLLLDTASR
jgi:uncharacterized protein (TIGR01244 family)